MCDIHSNLKVWLSKPELIKPKARKGKVGRRATKLKLKSYVDKAQCQRVDKIVKDRWHHHISLVCLATVFMAKEKAGSALIELQGYR